MIRSSCVAGRFYPGQKAKLKETVAGLLASGQARPARAILAPHAGYMYCGAVAGQVYSCVSVPGLVLLLGPNHTGLGASAAVMASGQWETPLGSVEIDEGAAAEIIAACPLFTADSEAHLTEHSLEVQLPFIQMLNPAARIVPMTIMAATASECEQMGEAIARALSGRTGGALIVASTDMNHYEPDSLTREKDSAALERVLALDARGLLEVTRKKDITMCGATAAAIAIYASKALGAKKARLAGYATSSDVSGDMSEAVGYAGVVIE